MKAAELDAVTIDAYGTLLTIVDPVASLHELLPAHDPETIEAAFRREAAYYREHASAGSDARRLERLHERSVAVFNEMLGSTLTAAAYAGAFRYELLPGVRAALSTLRRTGFTLAVVANWDRSLPHRLEELHVASFFTAVVAAAGKPEPHGILRALAEIGVEPGRAVHVGDNAGDAQAARAAGVRFVPAPLPKAVASIA